MDFSKLTIAGFGLAAILPFWQQVKSFVTKIFRIFWKQRIIPIDFAFYFYQRLCQQCVRIDFDDYDLKTHYLFSREDKRYLSVVFKMYKFELFLYKRIIPIFVFGAETSSLKIRYLKFTFPFEKIFNEVLNSSYAEYIKQEDEKKLNTSRFYISEKRGRSFKKLRLEDYKTTNSNSQTNNENKEENYVLSKYEIIRGKFNRLFTFNVNDLTWEMPGNFEKNKYIFTETGLYILKEVEKWLNSEQWYQSRNINWRRGILLKSKPGEGKSVLILEIAKKLKMPIFIYDLSSFDNEEFCESINELSNESAILVFEDFDCSFDKRKNCNSTDNFNGLTFDCFINKLGGIKSLKNKFIFITTNHIEKIDEAVFRAGRIDEVIELPCLNKEEKFRMAGIVLGDNKNLINKVVDEGLNDTTAEFENRVTREALSTYWDKK